MKKHVVLVLSERAAHLVMAVLDTDACQRCSTCDGDREVWSARVDGMPQKLIRCPDCKPVVADEAEENRIYTEIVSEIRSQLGSGAISAVDFDPGESVTNVELTTVKNVGARMAKAAKEAVENADV